MTAKASRASKVGRVGREVRDPRAEAVVDDRPHHHRKPEHEQQEGKVDGLRDSDDPGSPTRQRVAAEHDGPGDGDPVRLDSDERA